MKYPYAAMAISLGLVLAGCGADVQTSSGAEYLARYRQVVAASTANADTSAGQAVESSALAEDIAAAASVEPILTFPAHFGLVRIVGGRMTTIPEDELKLWTELAERYQTFGSFSAISPLAAEFTTASIERPEGLTKSPSHLGSLVRKIRLGAARRHVDAVLIYEIGSKGDVSRTGIALADLTLLGSMVLPTRSVEATGIAEAMLLDVRNGYIYGNATATSDLSRFANAWGNDRRVRELREQAIKDVVQSLIPNVSAMFQELVTRLGVERSAKN